jgi:predicted enzyme related to lactoylglutathione lyase
MARVVHFEIYATDPERAMRFYQTLFGWQFTKWAGPMDYWLVKTGSDDQPGINGGLMHRQGPPPVEGQAVIAYVCTIQVTSVDETLQAVVSNGGVVAMPKMAIPGVGWLAYGKDPESNIFGFMQPDPAAA